VLRRSYIKAPLFNRLSEDQVWSTLQRGDLHPNDLMLGLLNLTSPETPDSVKQDERLQPILQRARGMICDLNAKGVSNLFIACRRLDAGDEVFWNAIFTHAEPLLTKFSPSQIINLFMHLSGHRFHNQKLLVALVNEAIFKTPEFTPKQVCLLFTTFPKFRPGPIRPLVDRLSDYLIRISRSLRPGDISIILNSLRNLDIFQSQLLNRLCVVSLDQVAYFKPQETVNTISSLAHFGVFQPVLLTRLLGAALNHAASFSSLGMALCLDALVKFEVFDRELTARFCTQALEKAAEFSCSSIANVLYALAKFDFFHHELVSRFLKLTRGKLGLLTTESISKLLYALSKFNVYDQSVMRMVCGDINRRFPSYSSPTLLCHVMDAMAKFYITNLSVIKLLSIITRQCADKFTPRESLCILHSFFTLGWYDPVLYKSLYPKVQSLKNPTPLELGSLFSSVCSLFLCLLSSLSLPFDNISTHFLLLEQLFVCNKCISIERPKWQPVTSEVRQITGLPSAAMAQVIFALRGLRHEFQQRAVVRGMIVDFALPELRVAVQMDGPKRFCHNSKRPLGKTLLKKRLLMQSQWAVASIPYHEWNSSGKHQRTFLKHLVEQASKQTLTPITHPYAVACNNAD